jgi:hypothetical protein
MVALAYADLGGISGVTSNAKVPASKRSRDQNAIQRLAFQCDPLRPFTGTIHVQASVGDPGKTDETTLWFDIAEMVIDNEGGSWSYEAQGEFSSIRVVCREGNYWSAARGSTGLSVLANGSFTINGISVSVNLGDTAALVAAAINGTPAIQLNGTIVADTPTPTLLRIYKTDGVNLVLADVVGTPLADIGITPGTFRGGAITNIAMLR